MKKASRPEQKNKWDHVGTDTKGKKKPKGNIGAKNTGVIRDGKRGLGRIERDIFRMIKEETCQGKKAQQKEKNTPNFVDSFFFHNNNRV